jgi:peptide/nickel transport system substrate-binding protein
LEHKAGSLAESWEIQGKDTIIFHLRKGVKWHNKPPTNGRELTAEDVVFSLKRQCTLPTAYFKRTYPKAAETTEITAPDPYTVVVKCKPEYFADVITLIPDYMCIFPKDAVEQFGNMNDWKNSIGTGPFMLTEFVPGSVISYVRNPAYWEKNPIGPGKGDQLPYLDGVKTLIIPDESTADAAFRTGQLDILTCDWERAQQFLRMPQLKHIRYLDDYGQACIYMRTDKKDSPFADKRVRQAMWLAIDNKRILDEYYGGEGVLLKWPIMYFKEYAGAYVPLEQMPKAVQELFEYHPDKAKQLLAEAGYPNGFKAKIICYNQRAYMDPLQMVQDMLSKVGIQLEIEPKDYATFTSLIVRRAYDDMLFAFYSGIGTYFKAINYTGPGMYNGSYVDDPVLNRARDQMLAAYPDEAAVDKIHREILPYLLEQAYVIALPASYNYRFWWPWVKNYSGEASVGYYNVLNYTKYIWIDQELKKSMQSK